MERYYLQEGDEVVVMGIEATWTGERFIVERSISTANNLYYDGPEVEFDENGKPYVERNDDDE